MQALSAGDTAWVLTSAALVMLMLPGLALFYGGLVRSKNSLNTLVMSMAPLGVVSVQWVVIGYALAFGTGGALVGGLLIGLAESLAAGYQEQLLFLGRGFGEVVPYVVMIAVLLVRPSGLFGTKELTRV